MRLVPKIAMLVSLQELGTVDFDPRFFFFFRKIDDPQVLAR